MIITDKIKEWLAILGSLLFTILTFGLYMRSRGVVAQQAKTANVQAKADVAQANAAQVESRHETDVVVQNLPEAPTQPVATADPATAAGKLRDDGFTRD